MQLLVQAENISLAMKKRAVVSYRASQSRLLEPPLFSPPPPRQAFLQMAPGGWPRELTSPYPQVMSREDSECFVERLLGTGVSAPRRGQAFRSLRGAPPSAFHSGCLLPRWGSL